MINIIKAMNPSSPTIRTSDVSMIISLIIFSSLSIPDGRACDFFFY